MNLRQMQQFLAVAEELHFGRAAARLNMAQPPLSQSIRRLELDLGVELFDRSKRSTELTRAGHVLVEEARRTIRQAEIARTLVQRAASVVPEVKVSFIGPALYQLLPDLLVRFRATAPDTHVRLVERSTPEQLDNIRAGTFDVGFITAGISHEECESAVVERARLVAAVPADSPLAERRSISLALLAEQPFLLPPQKYAAQSELLTVFKHAGLAPRVTQETNQINTALSLVGAGFGCSLAMATAALSQPRNVAFVPIEDDSGLVPWEMAMVWNPRPLSRIAAGFVTFVQAYVKQHSHLLETGTRGLGF